MATASKIFLNRIKKELVNLENDPPPGITCYPIDDDITHLECYLQGPTQTPYEKGIFQLDIKMPNNYPFDPPQIRFITPIYHPNIDEGGRICASILKKTEDGWKPSMNLSTTLISLHHLISTPNPDDPLDADIANEYKLDYDLFLRNAKEHTLKYAATDSQNKTPLINMDTTTATTDTTTNNNDPINNNSNYNSKNNTHVDNKMNDSNDNNNQVRDNKTILIDDDDDEMIDLSSQTTTQNVRKPKLSLSRNKANSQQFTSSQDSSRNKNVIVIDSDDSDDGFSKNGGSQVIITQSDNNNKPKLSLSTNKNHTQQSLPSSQDSFINKKSSLLSMKKKISSTTTPIEKNNTTSLSSPSPSSSQENRLTKSVLSTKNKTSSTFIDIHNTIISSSFMRNSSIHLISSDSSDNYNDNNDNDNDNNDNSNDYDNNNERSIYFKQKVMDRTKVNDITNDIYNQPNHHHHPILKESSVINNGLSNRNEQNESVLDNPLNNDDEPIKRKRNSNNKISLSCKKKVKTLKP